MKTPIPQLSILLFFCFFHFSAPGQNLIDLASDTLDLGVISPGSQDYLDHFLFTNVHTGPVVIVSATGSSGQVIPMYPIDPVSAGATDTIFFALNTNVQGCWTRYISVISHNGGTIQDHDTIYLDIKIGDVQTDIENQALSAVTIFPNPVVDAIHVSDLEAFSGEEIHFSLHDAMGRCVHAVQQVVQGPQVQIPLDDSIDKGIYFLTIQMDHAYIVKRICR